MNREITVDYDEVLLLPPAVEDWVGQNHIARYVREFARQLDLPGLGFIEHKAQTGRPPLGNELLLCAWLYGHLTKQRSTRGLERACRCDMGAIWLTGNEQPDHSTLWEFFKENRKAFKKVFKQSALVACRLGLVDMNFLAIDGTKVKASANNSDAVVKKDLVAALEALDQEIESYMNAVASAGNESCDGLPDELANTAALRQAISQDLVALEDLGISRLSMVDPDSRTMKTSEGQKFAYNAQAVVDRSHGIIVGCGVTQDANDSSQLNAMLDEVEETLQVRPALTGVDTGYFCAAELARAAELERDVRIAMKGRAPGKDQPFHAWLFQMNPGRQMLTCPIGGELTLRGRSKTHGGADLVDRYRCVDHHFCPFASICSSDPKGRVVEAGEHRDLVLRQWQKQEHDPDDKAKGKRRNSTVERHFGHVKRNCAFRQLEHRGLENADAVWSLTLCCSNLKTMAKYAGVHKLKRQPAPMHRLKTDATALHRPHPAPKPAVCPSYNMEHHAPKASSLGNKQAR